ncbi:MAG: hypothetical protein WCK32_00115 [Chlorobiaceae bacterium]
MQSFTTAYGELTGVEFRTLFSNGKTDGCLVGRKNILKTPYGNLVPQYQAEDIGRRPVKPLYFYKSGAIKSVALQEQAFVNTPVGTLPAELVTFHESGSIKRIFSLDGRLSGFWTSKNEFSLAEAVTIHSPIGPLTAKFIALQFYESGALKSLTLWPGEFLTVKSPVGDIRVRIGIAFYEDGSIRSLEPSGQVQVLTPVGFMTSYDNEPLGIHGDLNSLQFSQGGAVEALTTVTHQILVTDLFGTEHLFAPKLKDNVCGAERKVVVPLRVRFSGGILMIEGCQESYDLEQCSVEVMAFDRTAPDPKWSCAG